MSFDLWHAHPKRDRYNDFTSISVEGFYRDGKVELLEPVAEAEGSRVIVTWVRLDGAANSRELGLDKTNAADLRHRLATFAEDWDRP